MPSVLPQREASQCNSIGCNAPENVIGTRTLRNFVPYNASVRNHFGFTRRAGTSLAEELLSKCWACTTQKAEEISVTMDKGVTSSEQVRSYQRQFPDMNELRVS
jgi:hypothetical protein